MIGLLWFALAVLASPFKSKLRLEAENVVLRHQLIVLRRRLDGRVRLTKIAGFLSCCIAGFRQSCRFSQSCGLRRSCVATEPAFAATGVGTAMTTASSGRTMRLMGKFLCRNSS